MGLLSLTALKLVLAPILLWQGKRTRAQTIRLPEATGERSGLVEVQSAQSTLRLLVIGDSSGAGVGAATQREALACQTAIALSKLLSRSVSWVVTAQSSLSTVQAHAFFLASQSQPADIVLFSLGVNDVTTQMNATAFIRDTVSLWQAVESKTGARLAVFSGLPPVHAFPALPQPLRFYLGQWAHYLDGALNSWCVQQGQLYCGIESTIRNASIADMAPDGYHPGPRIYAAWGEQAAQLIAARIQTERP